jgi:hypothetical protein
MAVAAVGIYTLTLTIEPPKKHESLPTAADEKAVNASKGTYIYYKVVDSYKTPTALGNSYTIVLKDPKTKELVFQQAFEAVVKKHPVGSTFKVLTGL